MANLMQSQGELDSAMELYEKALVVYWKTMGEDHLPVAHTYNNIANVLRAQGKHQDSMFLYEKIMTVYKRTTGENHTTVADTYNNMRTKWCCSWAPNMEC